VFLYQRWIYKVDSKRINEFGFSGEMLDGQGKEVQPTAEPVKASPEGTPSKSRNKRKTAVEKKDD
jgi:hypothetical protein